MVILGANIEAHELDQCRIEEKQVFVIIKRIVSSMIGRLAVSVRT